jgi:hypothetical protein
MPERRAAGNPPGGERRFRAVHLDLLQFMVAKDVEESKKNVHTAAVELLPKQTVGVVCAQGAFAYRIPAKTYCEASKLDVTCFLFVQ